MAQSTDDLYLLALQMVEAKSSASESLKNEMAQELVVQIEDAINLELLSRMTKEQMDGFNTLLNQETISDDQITAYIDSCEIDINNITTVALAKVRFAYLGA